MLGIHADAPARLVTFLVLAFAFRLATLARSRFNEARLRKDGALQVGRGNSLALTLVHVSVYLLATAEGMYRGLRLDMIAMAGVLTYGFGAIMLIVVMRALGRLWTVKVYIACDHRLVGGWLFRIVRHPNYYLAIAPELVGLCLALHAYGVLVVATPVYGVLLAVRIRLEEAAMRQRFAGY